MAGQGSGGASDDDEDVDVDGATSMAFLRELAHVSDATLAAEEPPVADEQAIVASGRFAIERRLGAGGFGTVYQAFDRERGATVALKLLRRRDPHALAAFKSEFRSLVETVHDHLVQLYELHADGGVWFFTMELVEGTDALAYLRAPDGRPDETRLRSVFRQLADGLSFLHRTGKLHRDVKPSNVMVAADGRVVIVDFGLIHELAEPRGAGLVVGTPAYMAPEQAAGLPIGPAADWYAVGVMLHQALTGRLPDGAPPALAGVPADLGRLCVELLARAPADRPSGREVRRRLVTARSASGTAIAIPRPRAAHAGGGETRFVGRDRALAQLADALAAADRGAPVAVLVHGRSGMGKSALVHQFLADVRAREPDRLALFGRCFAQESAPYKGVDGLIDELVAHLRDRPDPARATPAAALVRLFPQLRALGGAAIDQGVGLRTHAFAALRELLARASPSPPLLVIDDLQWGDLDGAALLASLLDGGGGAPALLIATYRAEDDGANPVLRELLAALADRVDVRRLELGALDPGEAEALSRALLADQRPGEPVTADTIAALVEEAGGDPFLLTELTRHRPGLAGRRDESMVAWPVTLELGALLAARIEGLPAAARRLLEVVALAGQPIARAIAVRAAYGDQPGAALGALAVLRAGRLVRSGHGEELVPYHDRIRELVTGRLADDVEAAGDHHRRLAAALEAAGGCEPERLLLHARGGGLFADAARHAIDAARRAHAALAFDRAARLYREAIALGGDRGLRVALADALAGAGRPREAALAYLDAAAGDDARALAHRHRAAELLVGAGYLDEGLAALRDVLLDVDVALPRSLPRSLADLAGLRLRLGVRGLGFRERTEAAVGARALRRIDTCFTAALGLFTVNPVLAAGTHARHLLAALDAGEPFRVARALFFEAVLAGFLRRSGSGADRALASARALEQRLASRYLSGFALVCESWLAMSGKRWRLVHNRALAGEQLLRGSSAATTELDFARLARSEALWRLGELGELARVVPALVDEARERGSRYLEMMVRLGGGAFVGLAEDRPDRARASVAEALARWPVAPGSVLDARRIRIESRIALYQRRPDAALAAIDGGLAALRRTGLGFLPVLTGEIRVVRAFAALSIGDDARAARHARAAAGLGAPWAGIVADVVAAAAARRAGDRPAGLARLARAEAAARAHDAALFAAAMARRRGEWTGGAAGRDQLAAADAWMAGQGIVDPERMTGMLIGWS